MKLLDERVCSLFKRHWRQTLTYWSVFFSFGLCIAFLGPTVVDLRCQTHSSLQEITWVFFSQQLFLLVGASIGGIFKKTLLSSLAALLTCTLIISLVFAIIPLCHHVVLLAITMAVAGKAMGVIDTIANLQLVKLYQKDSATFLQALHFFIGLGALISPLVADPFLADDTCLFVANKTSNSSSLPSDMEHLHYNLSGNATSPPNISQYTPNISQYPAHTEGVFITSVSYAFWIMALINLPVPAAVLALMYYERLLPCTKSDPRLLDKNSLPVADPTQEGDEEHASWLGCCDPAKLRGHPATFFVLHVIGGAILFLTDGIIGAYAGFVYTFAVSPPLLMGHKMAAGLDSVFWASITGGRLVFIYLSYKFTAPKLLAISLGGVVLVQCMLMVFHTSCVFLFIGTCVLGLCISSVFPSMIAYTEDIFDYKGCATTVLVTSASTGEMVLQLLVGSMIHSHGSYAFLVCGTIASFISFCLLLLLIYIQSIYRNGREESSADMVMTEKPQIQGS